MLKTDMKLFLFLIFTFSFLSIIFLLSENISAENIVYFQKILDRDERLHKLNLDTNKSIVIPYNIKHSFERSNIVNESLVYTKFDNFKKSYAFYLFSLSSTQKKYLFMFSKDKKVTKLALSDNGKNLAFAATNYVDRPNIVKIYNYSFKLNKINLIFEFEESDSFHNLESLTWISHDKILAKIYQDSKSTQILVKIIHVYTGKIEDLFSVKTDYLKVFEISPDKRFIAYHPNNGYNQSINPYEITVYDRDNKKHIPLLSKRKKYPGKVLKDVGWSLDSKDIVYIEASGEYDENIRDFILTSETIVKSVPVIGKDRPKVILKSPKDYNILELWTEYNGNYLCYIMNKINNQYKLVLLNNKSEIEKEAIQIRIKQIW